MRKFALLAVASMLALGVAAAVAYAATVQTVEGKVTPSKAGTPKKPKGASLTVTPSTKNEDGSQPPVIKQAVLKFPKEWVFYGAGFPQCSKETLEASGPAGCKSGSKVGSGKATAQVGTTEIPATITAFNGPGGNKIELFTVAGDIQRSLEGTLKGKKCPPLPVKGAPKTAICGPTTLTVPLPADIQNPVGNTFSSLTKFSVTIKAVTPALKSPTALKGKKIPFFQTTGCPSGGWKIEGTFTPGTAADFPTKQFPESLTPDKASYTGSSTIPCTK